MALRIWRFCSHRFNQPWNKNIKKKKKFRQLQKTNLNFPHSSKYLCSICIIFTIIYIVFAFMFNIISDLEMI